MNNILYNTENLFDTASVLAFINDFTVGLDIEHVQINTWAIEAVVKGMKFDFPHIDGLEKASPFKKAANFLCYFVAEAPILDSFPADKIGSTIAGLPNHQNALVGFMFVCKALHGATLERQQEIVTLDNKIRVSKHSLEDIIDALTTVSPSQSLKLVSVLLEQLVYKTNLNCQYRCAEDITNLEFPPTLNYV